MLLVKAMTRSAFGSISRPLHVLGHDFGCNRRIASDVLSGRASLSMMPVATDPAAGLYIAWRRVNGNPAAFGFAGFSSISD